MADGESDTGHGPRAEVNAGTELAQIKQVEHVDPWASALEDPAQDNAVPHCCGCLCADPSWSCSTDTCVTEDGHAIELAPEAGFFELEPTPYQLDGETIAVPRHRVFYSFQPAEEMADEQPLMVLFNGGPGSSTAALLALNTGSFALDPSRPKGDAVVANPQAWTRFANLLYIDAPFTGFSYALPNESGERPSPHIDPERDAANFTRVILQFLARHPRLSNNQVILVGESYGAARASIMLRQLLHYERMLDGHYRDPELVELLSRHFARNFPDTEGIAVAPERIARQFSHMVAIQGLIAGQRQLAQPIPTRLPGCRPDGDAYQCDEAKGHSLDLLFTLADHLLHRPQLDRLLGVDTRTIAWMHADARRLAYGKSKPRRRELERVSPRAFVAEFGRLSRTDSYFIAYNPEVNRAHGLARSALDSAIGEDFLEVARHVEVFLTDAALDRKIWSPNIVDSLLDYGQQIEHIDFAGSPHGHEARPGWMTLHYREPATGPYNVDRRRRIRMPLYARSGHMVTLRQAPELLADIEAWYHKLAHVAAP